MAKFAALINRTFSFVTSGLRPLIPIIILVIYTVVGALIFMYVEGPNEKLEIKANAIAQDELIQDAAYSLHNLKGMSASLAHRKTITILRNYSRKLGVELASVTKPKWTIWGSIFYSLTVYTTIGYGNICPVTVAGRILTIIYAFIGIPLALFSLIALGSLFAKVCRTLWVLAFRTIAKSSRVVSKDLEKQVRKITLNGVETENDNEELLKFPVSGLILITTCWIFICAALFLLFEKDWSYGTSLYFTLISFTTIGFGDVLPSEPDHIGYVAISLLIGLSLVSTVITLIQQQIEALAGGVDESIEAEYQNALLEAESTDEETPEVVESAGDLDGKALIKKDSKSLLRMDNILSKMSLKNKMLYKVMPAQSRKLIEQKAKLRSERRVRSTQTDVALMESLIIEYLEKVGINTPSFANVNEICELITNSLCDTQI